MFNQLSVTFVPRLHVHLQDTEICWLIALLPPAEDPSLSFSSLMSEGSIRRGLARPYIKMGFCRSLRFYFPTFETQKVFIESLEGRNTVAIETSAIYKNLFHRTHFIKKPPRNFDLSAKSLIFRTKTNEIFTNLYSDKTRFKAQHKHPAFTWHRYATRPRLICQSCCWLLRLQGSVR